MMITLRKEKGSNSQIYHVPAFIMYSSLNFFHQFTPFPKQVHYLSFIYRSILSNCIFISILDSNQVLKSG